MQETEAPIAQRLIQEPLARDAHAPMLTHLEKPRAHTMDYTCTAGLDPDAAACVQWGVVERSPGVYDWTGYRQLLDIIKQTGGLRVQAVMSFHACGGNTGDTACITLPPWVLACGEQDPDLYFSDKPRVTGSPSSTVAEGGWWQGEERSACHAWVNPFAQPSPACQSWRMGAHSR